MEGPEKRERPKPKHSRLGRAGRALMASLAAATPHIAKADTFQPETHLVQAPTIIHKQATSLEKAAWFTAHMGQENISSSDLKLIPSDYRTF